MKIKNLVLSSLVAVGLVGCYQEQPQTSVTHQADYSVVEASIESGPDQEQNLKQRLVRFYNQEKLLYNDTVLEGANEVAKAGCLALDEGYDIYTVISVATDSFMEGSGLDEDKSLTYMTGAVLAGVEYYCPQHNNQVQEMVSQ